MEDFISIIVIVFILAAAVVYLLFKDRKFK